MIETERLILRPPQDRDRDAIAAMNADLRVSEWLGGVITRADSDAMIDRIGAHIAKHGFGFWVVERKSDGLVVGLTGLQTMLADMPPGPAIEAGWRFSQDSWGRGYATEAASAALDWGFAELKPPEIVAITAAGNVRSQAVMRRIGMAAEPWRDFAHPKLADDHPLKAHVTYSAKPRA